MTLWVAMLLARTGVAWGDVNPALPTIPNRQFSLLDFGGVGDGRTWNTQAFDQAVAWIRTVGGGRLIVPNGTFLTKPFTLTSRIDLHLEAGAVIQFPSDMAAYDLPADPADASAEQLKALRTNTPALIWGDDLTDVAITGEGIIDGGGAVWWPLIPGADGKGHTAYGDNRPKLVSIARSQRVHVQGVTIRNSPMYEMVARGCGDVLIEEAHINASSKGPNTDAIDPIACRNVLIRDCDLDVGDDNVAIKAIGGPTSDVLVENCRCKHGHGISIGSETYGGIHDVTVRDCTFDGTSNGIRIKSARDRGNDLYNFAFSNIVMRDVGTAITINMYYMDKSGSGRRVSKPVTASTPRLHGVRIDNVAVTGAQNAGDIIGLPESDVLDVKLSNVSIAAEKGMTVRDARGVVFTNVRITAEEGEPIASDHADLTINK